MLVLNMFDVARQRGPRSTCRRFRSGWGFPSSPRRRIDASASMTSARRSCPLQSRLPRVGRPSFRCSSMTNVRELSCDLRGPNGDAVPKYLVERLLLDVNGISKSVSAQRGRRAWTSDSQRPAAGWHSAAFGFRRAKRKSATRPFATFLSGVLRHPAARRVTLSDRIDHLLTHRVSGLVVFLVGHVRRLPIDL